MTASKDLAPDIPELPEAREYRPGDRKHDKGILSDGFKGQLECWGYRGTLLRAFLYHFLGFITVGMSYVVLSWHPTWANRIRRVRCDLKDADAVVLKDSDGDYFCYVLQTRLIAEDPPLLEEGIEKFCIMGVRPREKASAAFAKSLGVELLSSQPISENGVANGTKADHAPAVLYVKQYSIRTFEHQHVRYAWLPSEETFKLLSGIPEELKCKDLVSREVGISAVERQQKLRFFGRNVIDIEVKPIPRLLIEEVLNPFYCFQVFCIILWSLDTYYIYASCVLAVSLFGIIISLYEVRRQRFRLREMVLKSATSENFMVLNESGEFVETDPGSLVPGDIISIPQHGCRMPCDAVLIEGGCIVNESVLTGESAPITKTSMPMHETDEFNKEEHKRHMLFHGTHVIQTRYYGDAHVLAVVLQTGFYTVKGDLVRSILFPKPVGFKFYRDALRLLGIMAAIAFCGMIYSAYLYSQRGELGLMVLRALDLITIVVPPALPAALTVGIVYSQRRLKKLNIFCISPSRINVCGKVKLVCFDKTGTLTEEGLDLMGIIPAENGFLGDLVDELENYDHNSAMIKGMATCHSLTMIKGQLSGDPLDLKLFEATGWVFNEPVKDDGSGMYNSLQSTSVCPQHAASAISFEEMLPESRSALFAEYIGIVKQFPFASGLQRMSVVTRSPGQDHFSVYTKGSPEKIASLCRSETLPRNFHKVLQNYTSQGYRVIALSSRELDSEVAAHHLNKLKRDVVECDLTFLGLMVMQNSLKEETAGVIAQLKEADIRTIMATGDNLLTAISVARECGMIMQDENVVVVDVMPPDELTSSPAHIIWRYSGSALSNSDTSIAERDSDSSTPSRAASANEFLIVMDRPKYHFALTGRSFSALLAHFPDLTPEILVRGTIFARMSPDEKTDLVEKFIDLEYITAMVGDGANDCGALKAAHAGISLSEAEASVASPFTSRTNNIECVPHVIREGRCALVTSFGVFKYMALYSIVQFMAVLILYQKRTILADPHFLYLDMAITTTVAVLMGYTHPSDKLVKKRPSASLISPVTMTSVFVHLMVITLFQAAVILYLQAQDWFEQANTDTNDEHIVSWESSMMFLTAGFQDLILASVFSVGPPYRRRMYTNVYFTVAILVLAAMTIGLLMYIPSWLSFMMVIYDPAEPHYDFRLTILAFMGAHLIVATLVEMVVCSAWFKLIVNRIRRKRLPKSKFKVVSRQVDLKVDWPPVGEITYAKETEENTSSSEDGDKEKVDKENRSESSVSLSVRSEPAMRITTDF